MTDPTRRSGGRAGRPGDRRSGAPDGLGAPDGRVRRLHVDPDDRSRGLERLGDLLPRAARRYGLEDQLEQARAAAAWLEIVAERMPAAAGRCRLVDLSRDVATIEADEPIVAQEVRLRSLELLAALRDSTGAPLRQLRVTARHV